MQISKIFSLLLLFLSFHSINLNAMMQESTSSTELSTQDQAIKTFILKQTEDINRGETQSLQKLIKEILDEKVLKDVLYWFLENAALNNQYTCIEYIFQEYFNLFKINIFEGQEKLTNEFLLKQLIQDHKFDSVKMLIKKNILNYVNNTNLKKLADEKNFDQTTKILTLKYSSENLAKTKYNCAKKCCCYSSIILILGAGLGILLPYIL